MLLRNHPNRPRILFSLGMMALALSSVPPFLRRHYPALSEGWTDGLSGMLVGIALGCLILAMRLKARTGDRPRT